MSTEKDRPIIPTSDTAGAACNTKKDSLLQRAMDSFADFCRARSLFVLHYCTGCGAIELPPAITSRFDLERLGVSPMVTPRQADILLITGYVSIKTLKRIILTYEQMQGPKYVIGICSCTVNGGMYWNSYATAKQLNEYIPVDMYIAGCMPRPEAVLEGLRQLRQKIESGAATSWEDYFKRYDYYLGNQQHLFGNDWHTPTDVVAEARHYQLLGDGTLGEHTAQLEKYLQHHRELGLSNVALEAEAGDLVER
jgi:NADH-quinone oxidoreductase subunit B